MENKKTENKKGGIGFCGLLTIVFITLKLCGVITWSWVWILAPVWIPIVLGLVIIVINYILIKYLKKY